MLVGFFVLFCCFEIGSHVPQYGIEQSVIFHLLSLISLSFLCFLGNFDLGFLWGGVGVSFLWGAWSRSSPGGLKLNGHLPTSASLACVGL